MNMLILLFTIQNGEASTFGHVLATFINQFFVRQCYLLPVAATTLGGYSFSNLLDPAKPNSHF
jgi:hypothetical protein